MKHLLNPYFAIILAATLGGGVGVFIKLVDIPPITLTWFRVSIPSLLLCVFLIATQQLALPQRPWIVGFASLLNAVRLLLFILGYTYASIANAVIMAFTWPIWASLFGMWYLRERPSKRAVGLIGLSFIGIVVSYANTGFSLSESDFIGMAAMLVSAILFALSIVLFKETLQTHTQAQTLFYQNVVGAIILTPIVLFVPALWPTTEMSVYGTAFAIAVGLGSFSLFFYALKRLPIAHYGILAYWEILSALAFGVALFNEQISLYTVVGGLCIVTAGIALRAKKQR